MKVATEQIERMVITNDPPSVPNRIDARANGSVQVTVQWQAGESNLTTFTSSEQVFCTIETLARLAQWMKDKEGKKS